MSQRGDPGYSATAVLIGVCTLMLLRSRGRPGGVLTPATAIGDELLEVLPAAGVSMSTAQLG